MIFSLNWISQYIDISSKTPEEISVALNSLGLEVESWKEVGSGTNLISGLVVNKIKHPKADKLNICTVDNGKEKLEIVCGAENVDVGQTIILAQEGSVLPGNFKIKKSKIRGVESNGMICSLKELGHSEDMLSEEDKLGIHVIKSVVPPGENNILEKLGLSDIVFDISLTPNRADCLSIYQIAKELSVYFDLDIKKLDIQNLKIENTQDSIDSSLVTAMTLTDVSNIIQKETPLTIRNNLASVGIKSKFLLVDISNFVMLETGQPLHFFDASKIHKKIIAKVGLEGVMKALDGNEYKYTKEDIVIVSGEKVISIAGIIGSKDTAITELTKNIIIEAAAFDRKTIRKSSNRLNLLTDSSNRFSKGRDVNQISVAISRAIELIKKSSPAVEVGPIRVSGEIIQSSPAIEFDFKKVQKYLGFSIEENKMEDILEKLDFIIGKEYVSPPTIRVDIEKDVDVIEEIARINGYDNMPNKFVESAPSLLKNNEIFDFNSKVKDFLTNQGLNEVITYSLVSKENYKDFALEEGKKVILLKPLSIDREVMRLSSIPSLLEVIKYNIDRNNKDLSIFEITDIYGENNYTELSIALTGRHIYQPLQSLEINSSFFCVKGYVESLMEELGFSESRFTFSQMESNSFFNHFNSSNIMIGKEIVGRLGEVHPMMLKNNKVPKTFIVQINLTKIKEQKFPKIKISEISKFPSVEQDFTFDINLEVPIMEIKKLILKSSKFIFKIEFIDIYKGDKITEGKKAVTARVTYNKTDSTFTEEEINSIRNQIISNAKKIEATFRG